jgi:hypothetical protein
MGLLVATWPLVHDGSIGGPVGVLVGNSKVPARIQGCWGGRRPASAPGRPGAYDARAEDLIRQYIILREGELEREPQRVGV